MALSPQFFGVNFSNAADAADDRFAIERSDDDPTFYHDAFLNTASSDAAIAPYAAYPSYNIVREPFLWERIQPTLSAALDSSYLARLTTEITAVTSRGAVAILDPHNYGLYSPDGVNNYLIGSTQVPASAFYDLWTRLANAFKSNPLVHFGLMNEPINFTGGAAEWAGYCQGAIDAIRATGATNKIWVPGIGNTNAWSWFSLGNDTALDGLTDSANNFGIEIHSYADSDRSGTHYGSLLSETTYADTLDPVTDWLRTKGWTGLLGEFMVSQGTGMPGERALANAVRYLRDNDDVWVAATAWQAGALPSGDINNITVEPDSSFPGRRDIVMRSLMVAGSSVDLPVNVTPGVITGFCQEGSTLTCSAGVWSHDGVVDLGFQVFYQWQGSADGETGWADIPGETDSTIVLQLAEVTKYLRCRQYAKNIGGTTTDVYTRATSHIGSGAPAELVLSGSDLTVAPWAWHPSSEGVSGKSSTATTLTGPGGSNPIYEVQNIKVRPGQEYEFAYLMHRISGSVSSGDAGMAEPGGGANDYAGSTLTLSSGATTDYVGSGGKPTHQSASTSTASGSDWLIKQRLKPVSGGLSNLYIGIPGSAGSGTLAITGISVKTAPVSGGGGGGMANLLTGSDLSASPWAWNRTRGTESVSSTVVTANASDNIGGIVRTETVTVSSLVAFDLLIEFQNVSGSYGNIGIASPSGGQRNCWFDVIGSSTSGSYTNTLTGTTLTITSKGSGWYEAKISGTIDQTGSWTVWFGIPDTINGSLNYRNAAFNVGSAGVDASLAGTEKPDAVAVTAAMQINASLAGTEGPDATAVAVTIANRGSLAVGEGPDATAIAVTIGTSAALAAGEGPDATAAAATVANRATMAAGEGPDATAVSALMAMLAALAAGEGPDATAAAATVANNATMAAGEGPDATAIAVSALSGVTGSLAAGEGPDATAVQAKLSVFGPLAAGEGPDATAVTATILTPLTASVVITEAPDAVAVIISALAILTADVRGTEGPDVVSARAKTYPWHHTPALPGSAWTPVPRPS